MALDSPVAILLDKNGNFHAVTDGAAIPASTPAIMPAGTDGVNARYLLTDTGGRLQVVTTQATAANLNALVAQGAAAALAGAWPVKLTDGAGTLISVTGTSLNVNVTGGTIVVTDGGGSLTIDSPQLPASLSGSGNLKVAVVEALPTGSNVIGKVEGAPSGTSSVVAVAGADTTFTLKAANTARLGLIVYNATNKIVYVKFGSGATTSDYSEKLYPESSLFIEAGLRWTGIVTAISTSGVSGDLLVTELTA